MTTVWIALAGAVAIAALALTPALLGRLRYGRGTEASIADPRTSTSRDDATGAVRSVQAAEIFLPAGALDELWSAASLERLARTYWRFLSRVTLGLVRVSYSEHERSIVLLARPLKLLTFQAPEYETDPLRGLVRWRIARGLLVAKRGRDGGGYLQIEVQRRPAEDAEQAHLHVEVEVANFYPSIAAGLSRRIYDVTQSRIHVIITHRFLRSLQRLDLAESRVRRLAPAADAGGDGAPRRPRVAILIVNGFARRGPLGPQRAAEALRYPWIELCLRQIERYSKGWDYEVLVFDNSHFKSHRKMMREFEHVRVLPSGFVATLGRIVNRIPGRNFGRLLERRHPSALDYLARKAPADRDYIVTVDNDSFPVRDDWLDVLVSACQAGAAVSGVYRNELAPVIHPFIHVSGLCVSRHELLALNVSFGRDLASDEQSGEDGGYNQDVGQKITYEFIRSGRAIAPLERSNAVNFHFILGGIYGDVIYHHGAGSRRAKFWRPSDLERNEQISAALRDAAFADVDHLVAVLRGQAADDLGLSPGVETEPVDPPRA